MKKKKTKAKKKNSKNKGIVLVLGGGGARGYAHIGVIEVLEENNIPIVGVIGTSSGAIMGAAYCSGQLSYIKELALSLTKIDVIKNFFSFPSPEHIFSLRKAEQWFQPFKKVKIEDLDIKFISVAIKLSNSERFLFDKGSLFDAVMASICIPGVFSPFKKKKAKYIDGGLVDLVPVDVAKERFPGHKIVAVDVSTKPKMSKKERLTIMNLAYYGEEMREHELAELEDKGAHVVIRPKMKEKIFEFYNAKHIINEGRRAITSAIPEIKKLMK